jgi:hypothetical protein
MASVGATQAGEGLRTKADEPRVVRRPLDGLAGDGRRAIELASRQQPLREVQIDTVSSGASDRPGEGGDGGVVVRPVAGAPARAARGSRRPRLSRPLARAVASFANGVSSSTTCRYCNDRTACAASAFRPATLVGVDCASISAPPPLRLAVVQLARGGRHQVEQPWIVRAGLEQLGERLFRARGAHASRYVQKRRDVAQAQVAAGRAHALAWPGRRRRPPQPSAPAARTGRRATRNSAG